MQRVIGLPSALLLGLGSILGTGVFVAIGLGTGVAGYHVLVAIVLAGIVALCNALSSAQLAAAYPVSGGTYVYASRLIHPLAGFGAGWLFLCAKSASASAAALGCALYAFDLVGIKHSVAPIIAAVALVGLLTVLVASGLKRSNAVNAAIVLTVITVLVLLAAAAIARPEAEVELSLRMLGNPIGALPLLETTALMFVAYTGYGRIATLGEEVHDPRRTIPRAIVLTMVVTVGLYALVAFAGVVSIGPAGLARARAPLEAIAETTGVPALPFVVACVAVLAMAGVVLNLLLGLSRVALAMARERDLPGGLSDVNESGSPVAAVVLVGVIIALLAAIGSIRLAWSFSACAVLLYYGLTNLAALRLPQAERLYPRAFAVVGLIACVSLAFFVEPLVWAATLLLLATGYGLRPIFRSKGGPE